MMDEGANESPGADWGSVRGLGNVNTTPGGTNCQALFADKLGVQAGRGRRQIDYEGAAVVSARMVRLGWASLHRVLSRPRVASNSTCVRRLFGYCAL